MHPLRSAFSASLPSTHVRGEYIEARTADVYTGPCFANAEVGLTGDLAVMGWKIDQGSFQGVNLDGLSVMGAIHASNTLGNVIDTVYPVKAVLIIDERAQCRTAPGAQSIRTEDGRAATG